MDNTAKDYMTPVELRRAAMEALYERLGPANFLRYISQTEQGYGDYTAEKQARQDAGEDESIDEIARKLEAMQD